MHSPTPIGLDAHIALVHQDITNHFCATCGTVLFRTGGYPGNADKIGLRAGVLDDQSLLNAPPMVEVYAERRPPWVQPIEGAIQLNRKYEPIDEASAEKMKAIAAAGQDME